MTSFHRHRNPKFTICFMVYNVSILLYNIGIITAAGFSGSMIPIAIGLILAIASLIYLLFRVSVKYADVECNSAVGALFSFIFSLWALNLNHFLHNIYKAAINVNAAAEAAGIEDISDLNPETIQQITELNNYVTFAFIIFGCILIGYFTYQWRKGSRLTT